MNNIWESYSLFSVPTQVINIFIEVINILRKVINIVLITFQHHPGKLLTFSVTY